MGIPREIRKAVRKATSQLAGELELMGLAIIPSTACHCGKPVVFPGGRKTFKCSRCGARWRLNIKVDYLGQSKKF